MSIFYSFCATSEVSGDTSSQGFAQVLLTHHYCGTLATFHEHNVKKLQFEIEYNLGPLKYSECKKFRYCFCNHILSWSGSSVSKDERTFCIPQWNWSTAHSLWAVWFIAGEPWMTPTRWLSSTHYWTSPHLLPTWAEGSERQCWLTLSSSLGSSHCNFWVSRVLANFLQQCPYQCFTQPWFVFCFCFFVLLPLIPLMPCGLYYTQKCATYISTNVSLNLWKSVVLFRSVWLCDNERRNHNLFVLQFFQDYVPLSANASLVTRK